MSGTIVISTESEIQKMVSAYRKLGEVSFDIETTGLSAHHDKLVMLIFKAEGKKTIIIDTRRWEDAGQTHRLGGLLAPLYQKVLLVGHNLKFDVGFMGVRCGLEAKSVYDTLIVEHVLLGMGTSEMSTRKVSMRLDSLAERYGISNVSKEERKWFYEPVPLDEREAEWLAPFPQEQIDYADQDVRVPLAIRAAQLPRLASMRLEPTAALENMVVPAVAVLSTNGQYIDTKGWMKRVAEARREADELEWYLHVGDIPRDATVDAIKSIASDPTKFIGLDYHILAVRQEKQEPYILWKKMKEDDIARARQDWEEGRYANTPFKNWGELKRQIIAEWNEKQPRNYGATDGFKKPPNVSSTDQLLDALHHMGIAVRDTKSETLERLEEQYPVLSKILDYRQASKIPTTYGQAMIDTQDRVLNRFFPDWEQYGASTGRFSSRRGKLGGYNAQNFPSRGKFRDIKRNVKAPPGWRLVTADFSNIELRILAEMTYCEMGRSKLLEAFASGMDIHEATARMMFGLGETVNVKSKATLNGKELEFSWRDIAKTINYGLTYGMGAARLAIKLKTTAEVAKELLKKYRVLYDAETTFLKRLKNSVDDAAERGAKRVKSRTMLGRVRWFDMPTPPKLQGRNKASVHQYEDELKEYNKRLWNVKLALANAPIQGTSADITKLAAALLYERLGFHKYIKFTGIIHDEFMLECSLECAPKEGEWPEETWVRRGERILSWAMQEATKFFLTHVAVPEPEVVHSHYWTHEAPSYTKNERWQKFWY